MYCKKCKYYAPDHLNSCPKCGTSWEDSKKALNLNWVGSGHNWLSGASNTSTVSPSNTPPSDELFSVSDTELDITPPGAEPEEPSTEENTFYKKPEELDVSHMEGFEEYKEVNEETLPSQNEKKPTPPSYAQTLIHDADISDLPFTLPNISEPQDSDTDFSQESSDNDLDTFLQSLESTDIDFNPKNKDLLLNMQEESFEAEEFSETDFSSPDILLEETKNSTENSFEDELRTTMSSFSVESADNTGLFDTGDIDFGEALFTNPESLTNEDNFQPNLSPTKTFSEETKSHEKDLSSVVSKEVFDEDTSLFSPEKPGVDDIDFSSPKDTPNEDTRLEDLLNSLNDSVQTSEQKTEKSILLETSESTKEPQNTDTANKNDDIIFDF